MDTHVREPILFCQPGQLTPISVTLKSTCYVSFYGVSKYFRIGFGLPLSQRHNLDTIVSVLEIRQFCKI